MKQDSKRAFLSGNAAIARGAWEAGLKFASAYPGTPSTEILEFLGTYKEVDAQWAVNEKTAMETVIGASFGGARSLCAQKHVGLNVAADPMFTVAYIGVNAGLVIVTADDPGLHSSQNEQDNRNYAKSARIPMFEPSNSQEAKDMTKTAFELSEKYDTPVLIRTTTRISHSEGIVTLEDRTEASQKDFERNPQKYCTLPAISKKLHYKVEERTAKLEALSNKSEFNRFEKGDKKLGIITSGVSYQHAKEVFPNATYLKVGMSWPFPTDLFKKLASYVEKVVVIEENDAFLETAVKSAGIECIGKDKIPVVDELNPDIIYEALKEFCEAPAPASAKLIKGVDIPVRPPVLCPGCPHRGVFYTLRKLDCTVTGDIGCYSLGALSPHKAMHSIVCMGGSITTALGMTKAMKDKIKGKLVAVIGESTFMHSGMTGLLDTIYNKGSHLTIILDNSITAMTGHQPNPASGKTLKGEATKSLDIEAVCKALGVENVTCVDPFDLEKLETTIKEALKREEKGEPSVIITKRPCFLLKDYKPKTFKVSINRDKCVKCGMCMKLGCPALEVNPEDGKTVINYTLCVHCGLCAKICRPVAILQATEEAK